MDEMAAWNSPQKLFFDEEELSALFHPADAPGGESMLATERWKGKPTEGQSGHSYETSVHTSCGKTFTDSSIGARSITQSDVSQCSMASLNVDAPVFSPMEYAFNPSYSTPSCKENQTPLQNYGRPLPRDYLTVQKNAQRLPHPESKRRVSYDSNVSMARSAPEFETKVGHNIVPFTLPTMSSTRTVYDFVKGQRKMYEDRRPRLPPEESPSPWNNVLDSYIEYGHRSDALSNIAPSTSGDAESRGSRQRYQPMKCSVITEQTVTPGRKSAAVLTLDAQTLSSHTRSPTVPHSEWLTDVSSHPQLDRLCSLLEANMQLTHDATSEITSPMTSTWSSRYTTSRVTGTIEYPLTVAQTPRFGVSTPRASGYVECQFCKTNGERSTTYTSHALRDSRGKITCPILRRYVCPTCGASGDDAHTASYCPSGSKVSAVMVAKTPRKSCGCSRRCRHHDIKRH